MNFKKSKLLMLVGFILGILIILIGIGFENEKIIGGFFAVGTIIFIASLVQAFIFYTCPHCGHSLMDVRGGIPPHCPFCGEELNGEMSNEKV